MNYKTFPIILGLEYTLISTVLSVLNLTDIKAYIILFAIASVITEIIYYPLSKRTNYVISAITVFWVILSIYFILQIFGVT
ncbi:hypothetical protein [Saccharolobus islandicus]|uniref:Uncharacterized protein n=3 Tax=Saccharolobus islandicus TaxID=43080 RepID=C4KF60_SACI6|nr:hypothetical protein [Sulfolobus islandicus]ACP54602.1 hypothetical protein M1627_0639 [Sulfolobus islandicus M.16.27]ACR41276.1 hypothetical protein M164_0658 [Sulfolobus islandicus M.16.4]ADX81830.1 hypothetical protein SiH_0465 [Sulfolobus islandicus HVE10/4]WCM36816.1 hypothetical protein GO599_04585 [Sulfolobus islandicus]